MTRLLLMVLLCSSIGSWAQQNTPFLVGVNGSILKPNKTNEGIEGTPYLVEDWLKGHVVSDQNKQFSVQKMKFNVLQNRVEYEQNDVTYEPAFKYGAFVIEKPNNDGSLESVQFKSGFPAVGALPSETFYEVLYDGKSKLLRHYFVRINEYAEPLSTIKIKRFTKVTTLYVYHPQKNTMTKITKNRDEMAAVFDDKSGLMTKYIMDKKIRKNLSEEALIDFCKLYDEANN
jgi:hypothetical protein